MHLRGKFSMLLAGCVVLAVLFTTIVQSRFFASDQEAYLNDFQSTLALFSERQLEARLNVLHSQLGALLASPGFRPQDLPANLPGCLGAELLPKDRSRGRWTLTRSPFDSRVASVRWIGRFARGALALDLKAEWFDGILESTHGATTQLVASDGAVLLRPSTTPIHGVELFHAREALTKMWKNQPGVAQTVQYATPDRARHLGTFLTLAADPPVMITVTSPYSAIEAAVRRVYLQSAWVAVVFLVLSIGAGVLFAGSLTSRLQALVTQSAEIAQGNFETTVAVPARPRDEVALLARSFNRMILELRRIRDELRKTERLAALGKFSSAIAHEIKNPLGAILGNTQVARRKLAPRSELPEMKSVNQALEFVEEETLRANQIVTRLMKFARQDKPPENPVDIAERVRRSLAIVQPLLEQEKITVDANIPDHPVTCIANGDQIHEVLLNLIQNALHAMRGVDRRELDVRLEVEDRVAVLRIVDSGHGIKQEDMDHLFEPFFTTKGIGEGTGLGLAVCHGIVLNHRGTIDVHSGPGKGTEFVIRIPLK